MWREEMRNKTAPTKRKLYIIHGNAKAFKIMEIWQPNEKSANIIRVWQSKVKHTASRVKTEMNPTKIEEIKRALRNV